MTQPSGRGNDINLAALWIPVMPETSHMGEEMKKAGSEAKRQFEQGFNSGASPESLGQSYGSKLAGSLSKEFKNFDLPYGLSGFLDKFSGDVDEKVVKKLRGEATQALQSYRTEWDNLAAAQGRATEAENRLNVARDNGINKASIVLPLVQANSTAQKDLTEAHTKAAGALENYTVVNGKLSDELSKAADGGKIMAGIMGGAIVLGAQLAVHAVESFVETVAEGFEKSVELTVELAKQTVELGETYEHIGIQIHEFSSATGADFESLESSAQRVFSTLDVAGSDTGKTMAQLSSMLGVSGESITGLVHNFEELQGRFTTLKAADLGSIFVAFKTPAAEADAALASFLQSARNSGQDLGQLTSALSGDAAITLHEAGLNIEQAGAFMSDLLKMGASGRAVMMGLQAAMKDFGQEGLSFGDGMKMAGERLKELGDTAEGQDLAEKLFGTRRWAVAMQAVQDYVDVVNKGPEAFHANTSATREFLSETEQLSNKIEAFKHQAEDAFKPFGVAAKNVVATGLNSISTWFTVHHTEIIEKIKGWGDKLIDLFPVIQEWVANAIELAGTFAEALLQMFEPVATTLAAAGAGFLALSGHFKDAKDLLVATANFDPSKIGDMTKTLADGIRNIKYDSADIKASWDATADAAARMPTTVGTGLGQPGATPSGAPGSSGWGPPPPSSFPAPGPTGSFGLGGPGGQPWFPAPGAAAPPPGPPVGPGGHHADWDAIAQQESSGRWTVPTPGPVPYGGGLQIKSDTWYEFGGLAYAQLPYQATKEQQIAIAERILNGWGTRPGQGPKAWAGGSTYVERKQKGGMITSGSGQGDDVASLLGKGEYVWDTETVDKYGWLIKALHQGTAYAFQGGGQPGSSLDTKGAQVDTIAVAEAAQQLFGINDIGMYRSADGYNEHASGEAADVMVGTNKSMGDQVAQYFLQNAGQFGVQYLLWQQTQWNPDGTKSKMADRGGATANHMDHVHVRTLGGGFPPGADQSGFAAPSSGQTSNTPSAIAAMGFGGAGSTPGGTTGASFPGMTGQYGGGGVYGGETEDARRAAEKSVQEARDRAADLDHTVQQNQKRIDDLKTQLAQVGTSTKTGALGLPIARTPDEQKQDEEKRKQLNDQLNEATYQLTVSQRERTEQDANITDAQRKQQEAMYKKPSGTTTTQKAVGESEFSQLGSSLLGGIGEELGFGDLFAKPPWEWGAVKLLTGAASWALGTANAWADEIGKGHTGMTGFQPIAGWDQQGSSALSGLAGSVGINLPKASVSSGPNVIPVQPGTTQHGMGQGQPPGPVIQGDYMPINVSPNVDPSAVLGPVQEQRNAQASTANTYLHGGVPAQ
jgi:ParB-like chromosome segregation protein Spo0J